MYRLFRSSAEPSEPRVSDAGLSPELRQNVVRVFALVGEAIAEATHALLAGDRELAKRVVDQDMVIDDLVDEMVTTAEQSSSRTPGCRLHPPGTADVAADPARGRAQRRPRRTHRAPRRARAGPRDVPSKPRARRAHGRGRLDDLARSDRRHHRRQGEAAGAIEDIDDELDDLHVSLTAEFTSGSMSLPVAVEVRCSPASTSDSATTASTWRVARSVETAGTSPA